MAAFASLTSNHIARCRVVYESTLTDTITRIRRSETPDGKGGTTETETSETLQCRVSPDIRYPAEGVVFGQYETDLHWLVTVPHGSDVLSTDGLTYHGRSFEIVGIDDPRTWALAIRLRCKEHR